MYTALTNQRVAQTFDEIDASVATPDKRSVQVVRYSWKTMTYQSRHPGATISQTPVQSALLSTLTSIEVCNAQQCSPKQVRMLLLDPGRVRATVQIASRKKISPA